MDEPNADERKRLAKAVTKKRISTYGTKLAAYYAAGLNSATWDRLEAGKPMRPDRLIAAVKTLWPYTGGDWRLVSGVPADTGPSLSEYHDDGQLGSIERRLEDLQRRVQSAESRLDQLELSSPPDSRQVADEVELDSGPEALLNSDVTEPSE